MPRCTNGDIIYFLSRAFNGVSVLGLAEPICLFSENLNLMTVLC
uniref:Uncharacterized protein n=1 Tax=Rhizophora mucronata TaxID=61149 RepID=A0A2P2MY04_RHIMU